jgi:DNA-binding response OmpR family regulator
VSQTIQRIQVVEDDPRIADLIVKNLEAAGYSCHASHDGGHALADFARLRPALIVLDLGLAGLDGLEVTRRIRRESDVPILMVTARAGESDKLLGLELGADDYITKPFSTAELVARVRSASIPRAAKSNATTRSCRSRLSSSTCSTSSRRARAGCSAARA